jgi:hypothetical protein
VTFSWVKAYVGIYGNELADGLLRRRLEATAPALLSTEFL